MEFTQGVRFDALGLTEEVQRALKKKNIEESTPVQAGCIPPMREWKDVIAKAPTGTGKTFAFGIPIIEHIEPGSEETEAVILAPTRELAMQITAELRDLCVYLPGVRIVCLYGGAPIGKQIDALKKHPQIVVATPGRLSDHMKRRTVKLDNVKTVVLDEADRMLDMGFIHDVTRILDKLSSRRNLGMFSATISREVMDISWMYQRDPEEITVQAKEENKPDIAQYRIDVGQNDKAHVMAQIIRAEGHERVMAFCNTKGMTERLKAFLMMEGLEADCIHGDIPQKKREAVMARFRRGELPIFVATDVAARGIDVDDVDCVINYDIHWNPVRLVQRFGRIDRIGSRNVVIQMINFWPDVQLDAYIDLRARVETRMKALVLSSTGDDNPLSPEEKGDLEYRREQLQRLRTEVVDLEDMRGGVSITDLGLNEFRMELLEYAKHHPELETCPGGISAVAAATPDAPPGVVFVLKNVHNEVNINDRNRLHPYYLVYLDEDGVTLHSHLCPKDILDAMRQLCRGQKQPDKALCRVFNAETDDGRKMQKYSDLLEDAVLSIVDAKTDSDLDSLFRAGGTTALLDKVSGLDDFELICFIVVREGASC